MTYDYMDKAVYIRETRNGKTKWVRIPGVTANLSSGTVVGKGRVIRRVLMYFTGAWQETETWDSDSIGMVHIP